MCAPALFPPTQLATVFHNPLLQAHSRDLTSDRHGFRSQPHHLLVCLTLSEPGFPFLSNGDMHNSFPREAVRVKEPVQVMCSAQYLERGK